MAYTLNTASATYGDYALAGLGGAYDTMTGYTPPSYPSFTPSQSLAPTTMQYAGYTPNAPMAQVTAPNYQLSAGASPTYQGMMGGDYDALQQALMQPGQIAAQNAYGQGYTNLKNVMGGRGLYGSSIMGNQATQGLDRTYQDTLASNAAGAAATRYGMQAEDLGRQNEFGLNLFQSLLGREQNQNEFGLNSAQFAKDQNYDLWRSGLANAERQDTYGTNKLNWDYGQAENLRNWQNSQNLEKYQYDLAANAYKNQMNEADINQYLSLAGQGAPLSTAASNYQLALQQLAAQQSAAGQASSSQDTASWLGLLGTLGGGLLGNTSIWS